LYDEVTTYCGTKRPTDDITVVIVKVVGEREAQGASHQA
jgi:hypothetical protein